MQGGSIKSIFRLENDLVKISLHPLNYFTFNTASCTWNVIISKQNLQKVVSVSNPYLFLSKNAIETHFSAITDFSKKIIYFFLNWKKLILEKIFIELILIFCMNIFTKKKSSSVNFHRYPHFWKKMYIGSTNCFLLFFQNDHDGMYLPTIPNHRKFLTITILSKNFHFEIFSVQWEFLQQFC